MVFVLWSSPIHALIIYKCPIKKSEQITPTYLNGGQRTLEGGRYLNYDWKLKIYDVYMNLFFIYFLFFMVCEMNARGIGPKILESQLLRKLIFLWPWKLLLGLYSHAITAAYNIYGTFQHEVHKATRLNASPSNFQ